MHCYLGGNHYHAPQAWGRPKPTTPSSSMCQHAHKQDYHLRKKSLKTPRFWSDLQIFPVGIAWQWYCSATLFAVQHWRNSELSGLGLAFPPTPVLSDFACERLSVLEKASVPEYDSYGTGQKRTTFIVILLTNKMVEAIINSYFWASTFTGRQDWGQSI